MKGKLAATLLSNVMNWSDADLASERIYIEMMAELKYDEYQQYSQGMRFVESLAQWLGEFDSEDRKRMYLLIKERLIYISSIEIRQLIDMTFPFVIKPILIRDTKEICNRVGIKDSKSRKEIFKCCRRQTLFLGLSDGAHIDIFRRNHPFLSNEQIHVHYDFSQKKIMDITKELCIDLEHSSVDSSIIEQRIRNIVLLDDFSASGISFIRKEEEKWKGKIPKFFEQLEKYEFDYSKVNFYIIIYVATDKALKNIHNNIKMYKEFKGLNIEISISAIQTIGSTPLGDNDLKVKLDKYYLKYDMSEIEDEHYRKGVCNEPYLGFNECSLTLVLYQNTPNNSLPIIWFDKRHKSNPFKGLFPRISRHKEDI